MSFNLNNQLDFARATASVAATPLMGIQATLDALRGKGQWQISEAAYIATTDERDLVANKPARFHVFKQGDFNAALTSASETGGRRKAVHKFAYVDGQTTNDLGREGVSYTFECLFHGPNYMVGWNNLFKQLNDPRPGTLTHPVFGNVRVVPRSWTTTHQSEQRQAMIVRLEFIEHNFTIIQPGPLTADKTVKGTLSSALSAFQKLSDLADKIQAQKNFITSLRLQLLQGLQQLTTDYRANLVALNLSFNTDTSVDIPGAVPVNSGGTTNSTGSDSTGSVAVGVSPNDPFQGTLADASSYSQTAPLTASQAVAQVNAFRAQVNTQIQAFVTAGLELDFYDEIVDLRDLAINLQKIVEAGVKTSRPKVIDYKVPRVMTLREVAFANGLNPDQQSEIDQLNPTLDSVNYIEAGTVLQIPLAR